MSRQMNCAYMRKHMLVPMACGQLNPLHSHTHHTHTDLSLSLSLSHTHTHTHTVREYFCLYGKCTVIHMRRQTAAGESLRLAPCSPARNRTTAIMLKLSATTACLDVKQVQATFRCDQQGQQCIVASMPQGCQRGCCCGGALACVRQLGHQLPDGCSSHAHAVIHSATYLGQNLCRAGPECHART
jgi:hypothetical protein